MIVSFPYGRSELSCQFPETGTECARPVRWKVNRSSNLLEAALNVPVGLPRLVDLARESHSALIVTCDRTRGVISSVTLPLILDELGRGGMSIRQDKILVATGLHKGETIADVRERLGEKLTSELSIEIHDSDDKARLVNLGSTHSGTQVYLNKSLIENDLTVIESTVEPHFFAGFTGGSKVILPGLAGTETVIQNHAWQKIDDPRSRYGILQNPIREEANEALRFIKRVFAINLIVDNEQIVHATSGEPIASFNASVEALMKQSLVRVKCRPDLVVTTNGGYLLDRNVYQCVKGIAVPEQVLHSNSKIVMVGECADGVAHEDFVRAMSLDSPEITYENICKSRITGRDIWQVQVLCRILRRAEVWFVTRPGLATNIERMHMHYARSIREALELTGWRPEDRTLVVPEGPSTILA